jgi:hypothetical protein
MGNAANPDTTGFDLGTMAAADTSEIQSRGANTATDFIPWEGRSR